ncbi:endonuclease [Neisseria mucosa]|uniref:Endonuclease n=1 Tax=Neisseria mucosa TaxID=488 RepID=A0AAW6ZI49_NEIMU|nr:endonuclease [Neisseria mucosa]MDK6726795.1 endonuclease [Neisseria mucosa]MDK6871158.1 endonuclease [Neisseria mucosa]MDK8110851.1 endonuclease [Neisseria mucosa]MDK8362148.1 endonuclease [Neisseria mucosa]
MVAKIKKFSDSTLSVLNNGERRFYVYCLTDLKKDKILYIGKGCDNRIFEHEQAARSQDGDLGNIDVPERKAIAKCKKLGRHIISYHLTEAEAQAAETTLIHFVKSVVDKKFKNKSAGCGAGGISAEALDERFKFTPCPLDDLNPDGLILAVKIQDALDLDTDEEADYQFDNQDDANLKSRTLGNWVIGKDAASKVKYIIGIHTGLQNAVVSAYEVDGFETLEETKNGRKQTRYRFHTASCSKKVLAKLGLQQKCLPELKFGSGGEKAYIRPKTETETEQENIQTTPSPKITKENPKS